MPSTEEGSDANASGSGAKSSKEGNKPLNGKLSDSDNDLLKDESLFGEMTPE